MKLLTKKLRAQMPEIYGTEPEGLQGQALVKFFTPDSNWTWYASEFDGKDTFYGLVIGFEMELGYFSLAELEQVRSPMGVKVERDLYFKPTTLEALQEHYTKHGYAL